MEIERKFTIRQLPKELEQYQVKQLEQAYLCTKPVLRIRKSDDEYILTYKSKLGVELKENATARSCQEVELPLTEEAYYHLKSKADGQIITKKRYLIPIENHRKIELDIFEGHLKGLVFAEIEFESEEEAAAYQMPEWFLSDVTFDKRYSNSYLSKIKDFSELGLEEKA